MPHRCRSLSCQFFDSPRSFDLSLSVFMVGVSVFLAVFISICSARSSSAARVGDEFRAPFHQEPFPSSTSNPTLTHHPPTLHSFLPLPLVFFWGEGGGGGVWFGLAWLFCFAF